MTPFGKMKLSRNLFQADEGGSSYVPLDVMWGMVGEFATVEVRLLFLSLKDRLQLCTHSDCRRDGHLREASSGCSSILFGPGGQPVLLWGTSKGRHPTKALGLSVCGTNARRG